jgi:hypothetical protein
MSSRYLGDDSTLGVVLLQQSSALGFAVLLGIAAVVTGHAGSLADVSATGWGSALAAGALYYGVAFWFFMRGLCTCSPGVAGLFINLVPLFGVTSASGLARRTPRRQTVDRVRGHTRRGHLRRPHPVPKGHRRRSRPIARNDGNLTVNMASEQARSTQSRLPSNRRRCPPHRYRCRGRSSGPPRRATQLRGDVARRPMGF